MIGAVCRDKRERHCNASRGRAGLAAGRAGDCGSRDQCAASPRPIRVTGFLVARSEAVVTFDAPGYKITEILAGEGDRVTAGQTLVRLTPISGDASGTTLKAPAAGLVTRSTAAIAATASPVPGEPLYRIAVDNEIELEADIPSIHVPVLAPGQAARVQIEESRELGRAGPARSGCGRSADATWPRASFIGTRVRAAARNVRASDDRCEPQLRHIGSPIGRHLPYRRNERAGRERRRRRRRGRFKSDFTRTTILKFATA